MTGIMFTEEDKLIDGGTTDPELLSIVDGIDATING